MILIYCIGCVLLSILLGIRKRLASMYSMAPLPSQVPAVSPESIMQAIAAARAERILANNLMAEMGYWIDDSGIPRHIGRVHTQVIH